MIAVFLLGVGHFQFFVNENWYSIFSYFLFQYSQEFTFSSLICLCVAILIFDHCWKLLASHKCNCTSVHVVLPRIFVFDTSKHCLGPQKMSWPSPSHNVVITYSHTSFTNRCTFIKTLITIYIKIRWLLHISVYDHQQGACN